MARTLAPAMRERDWGRIINIGSRQSVGAFSNRAPCGASKGGLMQFTPATAEYGSEFGGTCNAIAPGLSPTPLTAAVVADAKSAQTMARRTRIGRNGALPDLYGTAIFLAGDASGLVTGQRFFVDRALRLSRCVRQSMAAVPEVSIRGPRSRRNPTDRDNKRLRRGDRSVLGVRCLCTPNHWPQGRRIVGSSSCGWRR
ncbi:MAG: SDR family oxidoreductase [Casimicrobiaceae bacterium]